MIPPFGGIVESALYVKDLDRAREFYQKVFGFPETRLTGLGLREDGQGDAASIRSPVTGAWGDTATRAGCALSREAVA